MNSVSDGGQCLGGSEQTFGKALGELPRLEDPHGQAVSLLVCAHAGDLRATQKGGAAGGHAPRWWGLGECF